MEKYKFNPRELLSEIIQIMLRITHEEKGKQFHFLRSLAAEPDYSSQIIEKAVEVLRSKAILDETSIQEFESMNEEVIC